MQEAINNEEVKPKPTLSIVTAALIGIAIGGGAGYQMAPEDIDAIINNAKVITLEEKKVTIPERKEFNGTDSVTLPAEQIATIPTRDLWLDSTVQAGDIITVAVQHERGGVLIGNAAFRAEPTNEDIGGKFRVKVQNVR